MSTDRIEKQTVLKASPARVWRAISTAKEFGSWFGVRLDQEFAAGRSVTGTVEYEGRSVSFELQVDRIEPERLIAFRWHPYAVEQGVDYTQEPTTLVELAIEPAGSGTRLTIVESGFDRIPEARRAKAFEMNAGGWAAQLDNITKYVDA